MATPLEVALVAVVARMLREEVGRPGFVARLRVEALALGAGAEDVDRVIAGWQRMLARRESGEGPLSVRN